MSVTQHTTLPHSAQAYDWSSHVVILSASDLKGDIIDYNQGLKDVSGFTDEQLMGKPHSILRHPDVPEAVFRHCWETLRANRPWSGVLKNRGAHGQTYWVAANIAPIIQNGVKTGYLSVRYLANDAQITQAEKEYAQIRAGHLYPLMMGNLERNFPYILVGGIVAVLGFAAWSLWGYAHNDLGIHFLIASVLMLAAMLVGSSSYFWQMMHPNTLQRQAIETICQGRFGTPVAGYSPWSDALNQIRCSVAESSARAYDAKMSFMQLAQDLEVEKNAAEKANKVKSRFLANMSHEIRTPINAILGLTESSLHETDIEALRKQVRKVHTSSRLLLGITNDILDFSKIESGHLAINHTPFCLHQLLSDLSDLFEHMAKQKELILAFHEDERIAQCYLGDDFRIQQILTNLIGNAIKFTQKGRIDVSIRAEEPQGICFSVKDTGIGMTEEQQAALFQPFQQADTSITRRFGGTGLGLVISERLVKAMGGTGIRVDSQPHHGTDFCFVLPLDSCDARECIQLKASLDGLSDLCQRLSGHILLVDDNEMNQEVGRAILTNFGLQVTIASNGLMAVNVCRERGQEFNAVLMDIQMPLMDGYEATEQIRTFNTTLPIIALTAASLIEDREKALAVGMNAHLGKPINKKDLYRLLCEIAGVKQQTPEVRQPETTSAPTSVVVIGRSFDFDAGLKQFDGDHDTFKMLLEMFGQSVLPQVQDFIHQLDHFRTEHTDSQLLELRRLAHALKGAIASISAVGLGKTVADIHDKLRTTTEVTEADMQRLRDCYAHTQEDLHSWLTQNAVH